MKPTKPPSPTDGLEWLRDIRATMQRELGATPQERATYYQEREKSLQSRIYRPALHPRPVEGLTGTLREEPPKT